MTSSGGELVASESAELVRSAWPWCHVATEICRLMFGREQSAGHGERNMSGPQRQFTGRHGGTMKRETTEKLKYGAWGLVAGAIIATTLGFAWGGWMTGSTAKGRVDDAVLASRAAICVAQFMKAPNHDQELKAFQ